MFYIVLNVVTMEIDENRHRVWGVKLSTNLLYKNRMWSQRKEDNNLQNNIMTFNL